MRDSPPAPSSAPAVLQVPTRSPRAMSAMSLYRLILSYLRRLPGAMKEVTGKDGEPQMRCIYTRHSLRATTATLLLDGNDDLAEVQDLLGQRHIATTWIYDKRRRGTLQSASHILVI
jgi:site-specific recombinase XerC